jgi:pilus assembly protein Flp/PilA
MSKLIARFAKNESGATAIEYGLIGGIMAVALLAMFAIFTPKMSTALGNIGDKMITPTAAPAG